MIAEEVGKSDFRTKLSALPDLADARKHGADFRTFLSARLPADRGTYFQAIEQERIAGAVSVQRLCAEAGISSRWYQILQAEPSRASSRTITTLRRAIATLRSAQRIHGAPGLPNPAVLQAAFVGCLGAVCAVVQADLRMVAALDPQAQKRGGAARIDERIGARSRQAALYLASVELGLRNVDLARVVGVTPAAVTQALQAIEDLREDAVFNDLIDAAAAIVRGKN